MRSLCFALMQGTITLAGNALFSTAWAETPCQAIQFQAGNTSTKISGSIDPEAIACFSFAADHGQTVRIAIKSKERNTIFSVVDLVDAQDTYEFKSEKKTYEIIVGQLMRSVTPDTYQLTLSIK